MKSIEFSLIDEKVLPFELQSEIAKLEKYCFGHIDPIEAKECFYSEILARLCAFSQHELIGHLILHKRNIIFDRKTIIIGGAVGVCVKKQFRKQDVAENMMKIGLNTLVKEGCDVACLNVDLEKGENAIKLYKKLGFVIMQRQISFEDSNGRLRYDSGTMFIPLGSVKKFNHIMESLVTFHYGSGYW